MDAKLLDPLVGRRRFPPIGSSAIKLRGSWNSVMNLMTFCRVLYDIHDKLRSAESSTEAISRNRLKPLEPNREPVAVGSIFGAGRHVCSLAV